MSELSWVCRELRLPEGTLQQLCEIEKQLPLIAEVSDADVFLDVPIDETKAMVVAQACPSRGISAYKSAILGEYAFPQKEPAVFHAIRVGAPVCDIKAITQEGHTVRQNVAPVFDDEKRVIAVLIREKDISANLQQQRKYEVLARSYEEQLPSVRQMNNDADQNDVALREMHHRVKNNLQLIASILNVQARKVEDPAMRNILKENVSRVLSIATIHDILLHHSGAESSINSSTLMDRLQPSLLALTPPEKEIILLVDGDDITMSADTATSVSLVVTELVTNAFLHAFVGRKSGTVVVSFLKGVMLHTITVSDNGTGFDLQHQRKDSFGLSIVRTTVCDKLGGHLHINTNDRGTIVSFDFNNA